MVVSEGLSRVVKGACIVIEISITWRGAAISRRNDFPWAGAAPMLYRVCPIGRTSVYDAQICRLNQHLYISLHTRTR